MNVTFPVMNTSYRPTISTPGRRPARSERTKGDYDTVNIRSSRTIQEDDESFARLLARKATAQMSDGVSSERVKELGSRVANGTYQPDAQKSAGRLLGLG